MPGTKKVVITEYEYDSIELEREIVTKAGFELAACQAKTEAELFSVTKDADALIVQYADINRRVIENMDHCQVIVRYGVGINNIDYEAATEKGICVCNVPDYGLDEVSNQAVAMLMALARKLPQTDKAVREGNWGYQSAIPLNRLAGSTLGVLGCGRIGSMFIKKMSGFNMRILASDPQYDRPAIEAMGAIYSNFNEIVEKSDYISLHLPLDTTTRHMFTRSVFDRMKSNAIIINTSRGPIIHKGDLVDALANRKIAGAGIDVHEVEPIGVEDELLQFGNVIATPHISWYSEESIVILKGKTAEEAVNVLQGNPPFHLRNKDVLQRLKK